MSVYTAVARAELARFLADYPLGELVAYSGIESGIENTNYFVTTVSGEFVLTLFESTPVADLPYFLALMAHFAARGLPCAEPLAARDGIWLRALAGRPAALLRRLPGTSVTTPQPAHCAAIGATLARMHLAAADFAGERADDRGPAWRAATAARIRPLLTVDARQMLERALAAPPLDESGRLLPRGAIHADLFRDNALFNGEQLGGIIDFYYARSGPFLYDLAVAASDWCTSAHGTPEPSRLHALLAAYRDIRPLTAGEQAHWYAALHAAGLRFWLSRQHDRLFPRAGVLTWSKDPAPYARLLHDAAACAPAWAAL